MIPLVILAMSAFVHFIYFGFPHAVVFDEVHSGNFISNYWHGTYFFDVHPPLAKLIEVAFGYITGANNAGADFTVIGNSLPLSVVLLRLIPMIAGTLLPLIIYMILRRLDFSRLASGAVAILLCLENSLVVQSRFILFDVVMLFFGFLAILLYLESRRPAAADKADDGYRRLIFLGLSMVCAALAFSIKWTGLSFAFIIVLMEMYRIVSESRPFRLRIFLKKILPFTGAFVLLVAAIYIRIFVIHFAVLPKSGPGDVFMAPQFQSALIGNSNVAKAEPESFFVKFTELNKAMFSADLSLTTPVQYSSKWYTWPLMIRPIYYWTGSGQDNTASSTPNIYLLGNPVIYWLGSLAMILLIIYAAAVSVRKHLPDKALFFIAMGFLVNFLPFILIGRVMFLYHYEAALIFSIIAIVYLADKLSGRKKYAVTAMLIVVSLAAFIYWSPLTYGIPLSDKGLRQRMWFSTWR